MARLPRSIVVAYLDFTDTLKPGIFDALILVLSFVGVLLSYIQYYGRPAGLAVAVLSTTLLATALYLSLRSAAGLAHMAKERVLDVYLSYPVGRGTLAAVLLLSRVIVPVLLIIGIPALAASIAYYPLVAERPGEYVAMVGAFMVQGLFYGAVFSLIALAARSPGSASILSLLYYFTYNILGVILANLAAGYTSLMYRLSRSMTFYLVVYQHITKPSIGSPPEAWEYLFVPLLALAAAAAFIAYFRGWYEP